MGERILTDWDEAKTAIFRKQVTSARHALHQAPQFSDEALDIYRAKVKELFRYDLGYDLMSFPKA